MELKKPLTFSEQICRLKNQGIIINDEKFALNVLKEINYYRFTGYALQFRTDTQKSEYILGTTFDTIYEIYCFDEELRNLLRKYLEKIEVYYRTQISYGFSINKCLESPHDQHYDSANYYNKQGYEEVFQTLKREKAYYKDSLVIKHHKNKYENKMPLWVLVEIMSLSNLSKLFRCMYKSEKEYIANQIGVSYSTLENHLHCLSVLRNKCSHAARLYNIKLSPPARFTKSFLKKNPEVKNDSLFAYILILIKRLPDFKSKNDFTNDLNDLLDKYKEKVDYGVMGFPKTYKKMLITTNK